MSEKDSTARFFEDAIRRQDAREKLQSCGLSYAQRTAVWLWSVVLGRHSLNSALDYYCAFAKWSAPRGWSDVMDSIKGAAYNLLTDK